MTDNLLSSELLSALVAHSLFWCSGSWNLTTDHCSKLRALQSSMLPLLLKSSHSAPPFHHEHRLRLEDRHALDVRLAAAQLSRLGSLLRLRLVVPRAGGEGLPGPGAREAVDGGRIVARTVGVLAPRLGRQAVELEDEERPHVSRATVSSRPSTRL